LKRGNPRRPTNPQHKKTRPQAARTGKVFRQSDRIDGVS
jgi:hypothetical protein